MIHEYQFETGLKILPTSILTMCSIEYSTVLALDSPEEVALNYQPGAMLDLTRFMRCLA